MRIAFICGSLEEGSDGVGDYVLNQARLLQRRGINCLCIALSDRHINSTLEDVFIDCQGDPVQCTRISSNETWPNRKYLLRNVLQFFNPDWISLQYVPYAFHRKGLPRHLKNCLRGLPVNAQWHVMAHELWVDPHQCLSNRVLAPLQQQLLKSLIFSLNPKQIHTTNNYYQHLLGGIGLKSSVVPMFGSIAFVSSANAKHSPCHGWRFVLFGGILPDWDPYPLIHAIQTIAQDQSIPSIEFLSVGIAGQHGIELWSHLDASFPDWVNFRQLGPLAAPEISRCLQESDYGITTSPSYLLGKSSSVAAMIEHGLPVIVSRIKKPNGSWHQNLKGDTRFILFDQDFSEKLASARKFPPVQLLPVAADLFTESLAVDK